MKANAALWLFLIITIFHEAIGCGNCSPNVKRRRRSNIPNQILSEIDISMKQAKLQNYESSGVSATVNKCIAAEKAIGDIISMKSHSELHEAAKAFLVKINEWYHNLGIRQPNVYYNLLEDTFPNVDAIRSLTQSNFGTCFKLFVKLHASYEQYRKSEYAAAKYAENPKDSRTKGFMTEEGGIPEAATESPMHPQGLETDDQYEIYYIGYLNQHDRNN